MRSLESLFVVAAFFVASAAMATTVLYQDVAALSRTCDLVVRGQVIDLSSRWTADRRRIVTDVRVEVADTWKGSLRKTIIVRTPGGVVGDIGQRVDGLATFKPGEEVVLFLERRPDDSFIVSGAAQGKFGVRRSADGKGAFAVPDPNVGEAVIIDPLTRQPIVHAPKTFALEDLRRQVATAIAAPATEPLSPPKGTGTK